MIRNTNWDIKITSKLRSKKLRSFAYIINMNKKRKKSNCNVRANSIATIPAVCLLAFLPINLHVLKNKILNMRSSVIEGKYEKPLTSG